jgi:hypothetical protein
VDLPRNVANLLSIALGDERIDPLYQRVQVIALVLLQHLPEWPSEEHENDQRYEQEWTEEPEQEKAA